MAATAADPCRDKPRRAAQKEAATAVTKMASGGGRGGRIRDGQGLLLPSREQIDDDDKILLLLLLRLNY